MRVSANYLGCYRGSWFAISVGKPVLPDGQPGSARRRKLGVVARRCLDETH